ncbi:hypothetical protein GCM10010359_15840 [Streptomyces morookaense]|nr:hypothetical protein GCM10010359_15840 [Streptomyces morookaense]
MIALISRMMTSAPAVRRARNLSMAALPHGSGGAGGTGGGTERRRPAGPVRPGRYRGYFTKTPDGSG